MINMNKLPKLLLVLSIVPILMLSSCSYYVNFTTTNFDADVNHGERFWVKKGTKTKVSEVVYTTCFHQGIAADLKEKGLPANSNDWDWYNVALHHGKCLHDQGYVFSESTFSKYCYHSLNEVSCKAFRKYRH